MKSVWMPVRFGNCLVIMRSGAMDFWRENPGWKIKSWVPLGVVVKREQNRVRSVRWRALCISLCECLYWLKEFDTLTRTEESPEEWQHSQHFGDSCFFILFLLYVSSFQWISGNNSVTLHHELKCKKQWEVLPPTIIRCASVGNGSIEPG